VALLIVVALVGISAAPASAHSVHVIHGKRTVWKFHTAACKRSKDKFSAVLGGEKKNPAYAMAVVIDGFDGFGVYPVSLGPSLDKGDVFLKLFGPGDKAYSNFYAPPFPSPGSGKVYFGDGGHLMGVAFGPAMYTRDATDAVAVTGVVTCKYPHKRKKRR
jgi:hypothetical protein